jgi:hypothetical protein
LSSHPQAARPKIIIRNILTRSLLQTLALFRRSNWTADDAVEEPPLRSELFSADQMEQHGKALAASHSLGAKRPRDLLLARREGRPTGHARRRVAARQLSPDR